MTKRLCEDPQKSCDNCFHNCRLSVPITLKPQHFGNYRGEGMDILGKNNYKNEESKKN